MNEFLCYREIAWQSVPHPLLGGPDFVQTNLYILTHKFTQRYHDQPNIRSGWATTLYLPLLHLLS